MAEQPPRVSTLVRDNWQSFWDDYTSALNYPALCSGVPQRQRAGMQKISQRMVAVERLDEIMSNDDNCLLRSVPMPLSEYHSVPLELHNFDANVLRSDTLVQFSSKHAPLYAPVEGTKFSMSVVAALRMLMTPGAMRLGNLRDGASLSFRTTFRLEPWFSNPQLSLATRHTCTQHTALFLDYINELILPTVGDVLRHAGHPELIDSAPLDDVLEAVNFICSGVRLSANLAVGAYCTHFAELKPTVPAEDVAEMRKLLSALTTSYIRWRYKEAPVVADGARALFAAICSAEPVIYAGITLDTAKRGFLVEQQTRHYSVESFCTTANRYAKMTDIATYAKLHYALRLGALAASVNAPSVTHDSSMYKIAGACALLLLHRSLAMAHVASQFSVLARFVAVQDLAAFACDPAVPSGATDDYHFAKLVERLSTACWFGGATTSNDGVIVRNVAAPGIHLYPRNEPMPLSITYTEHEECAYGHEFGTALRYEESRYFRRRVRMLRFPRFKPTKTHVLMYSTSAARWLPSGSFIVTPTSRCGVRMVAKVVAESERYVPGVPKYNPPFLGVQSPFMISPLANKPPAEYISPVDEQRSEQEKSAAGNAIAALLLAHCVDAHGNAATPESAAVVSSSSSGKKRRIRDQQPGAAKKTRLYDAGVAVPTSSALAAYLYYVNHCQCTHPGIRVAERHFAQLLTYVNYGVLQLIGVQVQRNANSTYLSLPRATCSLNKESPLALLAKKFRIGGAVLRRRSGIDTVPFMHIVAAAAANE
jgi:hypothetical protein